MSARPLARAVASCGGIGFAPRAPGTVGSAAAVLVGAVLLLAPSYVLPIAVLVAIGAGVWAIGLAANTGDPGWVVVDECAGQWIAMLPLGHPSLLGCALAFALFRLFDIAKPGPIGWVDRRTGPWAVMGDDLVAGVMAALLIVAARAIWPHLLD